MLKRVHLLNILDEGQTESPLDELGVKLLGSHLLSLRGSDAYLKPDTQICFNDAKYVVVACDPQKGGTIDSDTVLHTRGPCVQRLKQVDMIVSLKTPSALTLQEFLKNKLAPALAKRPLIATAGRRFRAGSNDVLIIDTKGPSSPGYICSNSTLITLSTDPVGEYKRVHVVPFSDTIPTTYEIDLYTACIKPYFQLNRCRLFTEGDVFSYHGVEFKIVCAEPDDQWPGLIDSAVQGYADRPTKAEFVPTTAERLFRTCEHRRSPDLVYRRVGKNTTIHTEGFIRPSWESMVPPETIHRIRGFENSGNTRQLIVINSIAYGPNGELRRIFDEIERANAVESGREPPERRNLPPSFFQPFKAPTTGPENYCVVCLAQYALGEVVVTLPCGHMFHPKCITEWAQRSTICPLCREEFSHALESAEAES